MVQTKKKTVGFVLGKFLPPHNGHKYLIDFARNYVDEVVVQVGTLKREPIPGELRFQWMKEMFQGSGVKVLHNPDENPQYPEEHPDFWNIWVQSIRRYYPGKIDYVFASENYGFKLAEVLGATYIPVDHMRELVPISATKIRENPYKYWQYIPEQVRPYFVKKICIVGPESTGKSTLTKKLAEHFNTVYVHEYARSLLELKNNICEYQDIERIVHGHKAATQAMLYRANKTIFIDTDTIASSLWSEALFGKCEEGVRKSSYENYSDLYLLCDVDVPWVEDPQRYLPEEKQRQDFFNKCKKELDTRGLPYTIISGDWEKRLYQAVQAVENIWKDKKQEEEI